jgi:adenylyltransferase/sulfurtransferase
MVSGGRNITYEDLNKYVDKIALRLMKEYNDKFKLSKPERIRYSRQMLLYQWGMESQEKLKSATIFVAGAGGGASPTLMQLALAGFGTIIVCDYDDVELSNLNRQFLHNESRIGMNKALSAQVTLQQVNPYVKVIPIVEKLTKANVAQLVGDADILFDMFDGLEAKFILSEYATSRGIPHLISAMTDINGYTVVFNPPHTPCYHCLFDKRKWETIVAGMGNYVQKYEKNPLPVVATSLFLTSSFIVNEAIKIVLGFENPAFNKFFFFNQRGTTALSNTPSFQAMTHVFSDHFRKLCANQGFDWNVGWRGNYLEELKIEPDPKCIVCNNRKNLTENSFSRDRQSQESFNLFQATRHDSKRHQTVALFLDNEVLCSSRSNLFIGTIKNCPGRF